MGGKIALAIAARAPVGLQGLILLAPSPPTPEPISDADRAQLMASWGDHDAMRAIVDKIVVRPLSGREREQQVADMLAASKEAWEAWLEQGSRENIAASLDNIVVPVTVVAGSGDQNITTAVLCREVFQHLRMSTLEIVPNAGHLLPIEARDEVVAIIQRAELAPRPELTDLPSSLTGKGG
jgi:pimeloyl-ACP methyl ester carboxylesterase